VLSGDIDEADALRRTQDGALRDEAYFAAVKGVTVLAGHEVFAVDTANRVVRVRAGLQEIEVGWEDLVLATGARARKLSGQGEHARVCSFHTPEDLARLHRGLTGARSTAWFSSAEDSLAASLPKPSAASGAVR